MEIGFAFNENNSHASPLTQPVIPVLFVKAIIMAER
jgi:hypothetical protein